MQTGNDERPTIPAWVTMLTTIRREQDALREQVDALRDTAGADEPEKLPAIMVAVESYRTLLVQESELLRHAMLVRWEGAMHAVEAALALPATSSRLPGTQT